MRVVLQQPFGLKSEQDNTATLLSNDLKDLGCHDLPCCVPMKCYTRVSEGLRTALAWAFALVLREEWATQEAPPTHDHKKAEAVAPAPYLLASYLAGAAPTTSAKLSTFRRAT